MEYKLDKMMPTTFDGSLISHTLQTELSVNQRSRYLQNVPIFDLTSQLWPEVFSSICVVLRKVVCENREDVFVAGGLSTSLYITVTGEYSHVEGYDGQGDIAELSGRGACSQTTLATAQFSARFGGFPNLKSPCQVSTSWKS